MDIKEIPKKTKSDMSPEDTERLSNFMTGLKALCNATRIAVDVAKLFVFPESTTLEIAGFYRSEDNQHILPYYSKVDSTLEES